MVLGNKLCELFVVDEANFWNTGLGIVVAAIGLVSVGVTLGWFFRGITENQRRTLEQTTKKSELHVGETKCEFILRSEHKVILEKFVSKQGYMYRPEAKELYDVFKQAPYGFTDLQVQVLFDDLSDHEFIQRAEDRRSFSYKLLSKGRRYLLDNGHTF